jgi:hypothetical protein
MGSRLPVTIFPRVVTEFRRVPQPSFGNPRTIATQISVVLECCPGNWVVTMTQTKETAKAHHSVDDATGDLVDQQVVDFTDGFIANSVDIRSLNILADNRAEKPRRRSKRSSTKKAAAGRGKAKRPSTRRRWQVRRREFGAA